MSFDLRGRRRRPVHFARELAFAHLERDREAFVRSGICSLQHDMDIANGSGATVRSDLNNALEALATLSSGATEPSTTLAYQPWADTTSGLLKQRNASNLGWLVRGTLAETFVVARSSNTIIGVGDFGRTLVCTSTFTQTLTAAATLGDGFMFRIRNDGTGVITIDPNSSETIDGATTIALMPGESCTIFCNGTSFKTIGRAPTFLQWAFKNRLINPDGAVYQRSVAATADDAYFADRWYMLTQTNTVTPSVLNTPEDGYPYGVRITQSQASAQRFGFAQIIEGRHCKDLRGEYGTLVPRVRISNSQTIRYAILGWTGTEDSVTSDVVNDWTSGTYTAGNFFISSNLTVLAVGSATPSAAAWTSLGQLSVALGSSFNNIIIFVWTEGTAAQNVTLDFDFVQFERGPGATAFERRPLTVEEMLCYRYYEVTPGGVSAPGIGSAQVSCKWWFKTMKRATPTIGGSTVGTLTAATDGVQSTSATSSQASIGVCSASCEL